MSIPFFWYRRLSRWITCEFKFSQSSKLTLKNKYEVASFKDVFCHPFYWQVFQYLPEAPKLIVDCGAHCGHFSILTDICISSKFETSDARYVLVEPNPYLIPVIKKNIQDAGLEKRTLIQQGLLGPKSGSDTLWIDPKNYLATGLAENNRAEPHELSYLDLAESISSQTIDIIKIDIEGGEFEFINANLELFKQVNLIFMELHEASPEKHSKLLGQLESVGLSLARQPLKCHGQQLVIFHRSNDD